MRKVLFLFIFFAALYCFVSFSLAEDRSAKQNGEQLFNQHCAACHPDGGNIIDSNKTLHKSSMVSHGIKTSDDIIRYMRSPGLGMPSFDEKKLSDKLAGEIAEYILHEFK
jgi:cytochrome c6